jgi:homocysteine S-methyltransferase
VLPAIGIASAIGKPVVVYPNSGEGWDGRHRTWIGPSRFSGQLARQWVAAGARIVGGCCRVTPADIADAAKALTP